MNAVQLNVTKVELASMFGVALTTIDAYRKKGLPTIGEGRATKYNVQESIAWLNRHTLDTELKKREQSSSSMTEEEAVTRKAIADATLKEIEVAKARGVLVNISDVEKERTRFATHIRSHLLTFGVRIAPLLVMIPTETDARSMVDEEMFKLMEQIAGPIPDVPDQQEAQDELTEADDSTED